jgi:hypothetical protein
MTETAAPVLATFDSRPPHEQHEPLTELLRRCGKPPETFLGDADLAELADDLFLALDAEEADC